MRYLLVVLFGLCMACSREPQRAAQYNDIYRVVFETGGCFGSCPIQTFSIDSTLTLNYCGSANTKDSGYFRGKIDSSVWNELNRKLVSIHYKDLDSLWAQNTCDAPSFAIWIYDSDGIKKINSMNYRAFPDSVKLVFDWIENVAVTCPKTRAGKIKFEPLYAIPPPSLMPMSIPVSAPDISDGAK